MKKKNYEWYRMLPKKKQKEFRKEFIRQNKCTEFQKYLNQTYTKFDFYELAFIWIESKNYMYWLFKSYGLNEPNR